MNKALKQSYTFGKILNLDKILTKNVKKRIFTHHSQLLHVSARQKFLECFLHGNESVRYPKMCFLEKRSYVDTTNGKTDPQATLKPHWDTRG